MQQQIAIAVIVVIIALGAVWFFFLRPQAALGPSAAPSEPTAAATTTLGGSIYTKIQEQSAAQSPGSAANPANPFETNAAGAGNSSGYQNPFAR